jgi:hypothetical protein
MKKADDDLRAIFHEHLHQVHWQAIESGLTGLGIPDSNGCLHREFWVEHKWTPEWWVSLTPEQVGWHLRRYRAGGHTFIAVRRHCDAGPRRPAADDLYLFPGRLARELKDVGLRLDAPPLVMSTGGPAAWDWSAVLGVLTGRPA